MASLLIKNIPPELHAKLKLRAERHHRSLNKEVIAVLEHASSAETSLTQAEISTEEPHLAEEALAAYPPDIAARLRALRELGQSLATRNVDFEEWKRVARESRL